MCCKFYLTLLESQSPKIIHMCCTHLARLVANGTFLRPPPPSYLPHTNYFYLFENRAITTPCFGVGFDQAIIDITISDGNR